MALRVLLADESTTIKKVMQLALQDFAVEVKAVHAGVDVLDVARSYQPDIIFADVLLQKKNGYEVCAILKADAELKVIPVVLMWSSFLDLDEAQAKASGANARLEKPFDVETLRKQVLELVPKTRSQRLAHFLDYSPKLNEELKNEAAKPMPPPAPKAPPGPPNVSTNPVIPMPSPKAKAPSAVQTETPSQASTWNMGSFNDPSTFESAGLAAPENEDEESFQPLELSNLDRLPEPAAFSTDATTRASSMTKAQTSSPVFSNDDETWSRQDLSQFKLNLPPISVGEGHEEFKLDMGEQEFSQPNFQLHQTARPAPEIQLPRTFDEPDPDFGPDLTLDAHEIANASEEIALPLEPFGLDQPFTDQSFKIDEPLETKTTPLIPQLSADRLEELIRAQSREIIETVVRKLVPELATTIIREELERLLADTERRV